MGVWGIQQISTGFASWLRYCTNVVRRRSTKLCIKFGRLLRWHIMYTFRGLFPAVVPNGILSGAKFTLRLSLAFSYIGRVTARHSSSGRQPSCGVEQTAPPIFGRADITLGISLHSSLCLFYANVSGCFYHFDNKIGLKNTIVRSIWSS